MSFFAKFDRHAALMTRMADTVGLDLETEMLAGRLSPSDYRSLTLRCTGCTQTEACEHWLEASDGNAEAAPEYCRNRLDFLSRTA